MYLTIIPIYDTTSDYEYEVIEEFYEEIEAMMAKVG